MRRRLRSAAFPLHRHSLPQLAIDGALVAAAYYLRYRLRFDAAHVPHKYDHLFDSTIIFVVVAALVVFTVFRLERSSGATRASATTSGSCRRSSSATLLRAGLRRGRPAGHGRLAHAARSPSRSRPASSRCSSCSRWSSSAARGSSRGSSTSARSAASARASDARRVLIVGAGDGGRLVLREIVRNPQLGLRPSASSTTTRSSAACASTASRCSAGPTSSRASSTRPSPTR